jgi:hypothetical protein
MLFVAAVLALATAASAQEATQAPPDGLTAQDVQVLKEAVTTLRDSFQPPASPPPQKAASAQNTDTPPTTQAPAPQKSMADVADRVVDLGARAVAQAAGTVQKVAPEVWRIMIRQQYAKAAGLLVVPGGMTLVFLFVWFKTAPLRIRLKEANANERIVNNAGEHIFGGYFAPLAGLGFFGIWFLNRLSDSVLYLFNPEYHAFRDLLIMVLNQGRGL